MECLVHLIIEGNKSIMKSEEHKFNNKIYIFYIIFSYYYLVFDVVGKYIKMCVQLVIVYNIWLIVILWVLHILKKK